jgi:hypothetical protein
MTETNEHRPPPLPRKRIMPTAHEVRVWRKTAKKTREAVNSFALFMARNFGCVEATLDYWMIELCPKCSAIMTPGEFFRDGTWQLKTECRRCQYRIEFGQPGP